LFLIDFESVVLVRSSFFKNEVKTNEVRKILQLSVVLIYNKIL